MKYIVGIMEELRRSVMIEADNEQDAVDAVRNAYDKYEIVLDDPCFVGRKFEVVRKADDLDMSYYKKLEAKL